MKSFVNLLPRRMKLHNARAYRCARLEEIYAHRHRLDADHCSNFRWLMSLQVDEIEHFPLAGRQLAKKTPDIVRNALTVDAGTRIRMIDIVDSGNCRIREPPPASSGALSLKSDPSRYQVYPSLDRRFGTVLFELSIYEDEGFLGYLICFISIVGKGECPSIDERMQDRDSTGEGVQVSEPGTIDECSQTML